jgi:uncharacterized protein YllA (UPF0747 family)
MSHYEVEVKVLLGHEEAAHALMNQIKSIGYDPKLIGENAQLNHYFVHDETERFLMDVEKHLPDTEK